jgi:hypothetical protein
MQLNDAPNFLRVNAEVIMRDYVSQTFDVFPVDFTVFPPEFIRNTIGHFSDDNEIHAHGIKTFLVGKKIVRI